MLPVLFKFTFDTGLSQALLYVLALRKERRTA